MQFLTKNPNSAIFTEGLKYKENRAVSNKELLVRLVAEQHHFCAYSEKYIKDLDAVDVEHFDSSKKYNDDYFNYYAVLHTLNLQKKDEQFRGNPFFNSLFFHDKNKLKQRIHFIKEDNVFEEINIDDAEAKDLIEFVQVNSDRVYRQRKAHIRRLKTIKDAANYDNETFINYLEKHREELSFITAIEHEFGISLQHILV